MPSYNSDLFNIEPYYDDFDETKNYHKILFRPGYSVQARELTQLQTILQNQVERFGNHIFKDGSKVYGAESAVQTTDYLTVTTTSDLTQFIGYEIFSGENRAKVIHAEIIDSVVYLFVQVVRGSLPTSGTITSSIEGILATATINSNGTAKLFSVTDGIFFIDGYFVRTGQQYAPRLGSDSGVFGFDITRNYIGSSSDTTLLDPSRGNYNFNAPGADRFQIELDLAFHTSAERENFVPLATINANGEIINQVLYSDYSELEKALARRTYDQAGSYIVDPFELDLLTSTDESKTQLAIGTGRAYLFGYEFENQSTEFINIDKARTTENRSLTTVHRFNLGSYVDTGFDDDGLPVEFVNALQNGYCTTKPYLVNILKGQTSPVLIGSAEIISIQNVDSSTYRFYLHNIQLNIGQDASGHITLSVPPTAVPDDDTPTAPTAGSLRITNPSTVGIQNTTDTGLVYPVDKGSTVKTITDMKVRQRKEFIVTTNGDGDATVDLSAVIEGQNYSFVGSNGTLLTDFKTIHYHLFETGDGSGESEPRVVPPSTYQIDKLNDILTMSGLTPNTGYVLIATVEFTHNSNYQSAIRKKILRRDQFTVDGTDVLTDRTGRNYIALNYADIIRIRSITITSNDERDNVTEGTSVITDFMLDNGQRDYSYEFGRLYFTKSREDAYKDEDGFFTFSLLVDYDYFEHDGKYGFLTVDSYPVGDSYVDTQDAFKYEDIPLHTSEGTGKAVSLASSIDFRFVRDYSRIPLEGETREEVLSSSAVPVFQIKQTRENDILQVAHEYYLPRIDKLIIRHDFNDETTKFEVLSGTPAIIPEAPADVENGLTLYRMIIPAYTHNVNDIEVEGVSHKRYTMKDIGDVDKRLEKVEVFSSLSAVESKIDSTTFLGGSRDELEKKAILVDDFTGHGVGDVSNDDYRCSVDFQSKELRPSFKVYDYNFTVENVDENLRLHDNGIITLDYETTGNTFADQPKASETIAVNPYQLTNWVGVVETNDNIDTWFDDQTRPLVRTNTIGENDAWIATSFDDEMVGFGSQWNDWEAIWSGVQPGKKISDGKLKALLSVPHSNKALNTIRSYFERDQKIGRDTKSISQQIEEVTNSIQTFPDHITKVLRDKIVDLSVVPYMRVKDIPLTVHGLKPNTTMRVYIDNTEVTDNVSGTTLVSDDTGKISGLTLSIPSQTFLTGKRILRFIDSNNDISTATTVAETVLTAQGAFETRSQGAVSVRPIIRRKQTVNSSAIPTDVNTRKKDIRTSEKYQWLDPLTQTFFVDESEYPKGLFLQDIDLFFASKDSTLPITISIRPTRNGYPHPSAIIPFSEVVVYPENINADPDTPDTKTTVTFDAPVFLEPGEYSICLSTNSSDYTLYSATVGETELGGSNRIQKQVYSGKLFRPQNTNISEADYTKDLKFVLRRCVFNTGGGTRDFTLKATNAGSSHNANYSRLVGSFLTPSGTGKHITYSLTNGSVLENSNVDLPVTETISNTEEFTYNVDFTNSADTVSPVFDTKSTIGLQIENIINNNKSTADELKAFGTDVGANARYITKRVEIEGVADTIRVFVDSIKSINTDIEVYAKVKNLGDNKDFDEFSYIKLEREEEYFSTDPNDVVTEEFRMTTPVDFEAFAIKICLFSSDTNNVPVIKSMRTVALNG